MRLRSIAFKIVLNNIVNTLFLLIIGVICVGSIFMYNGKNALLRNYYRQNEVNHKLQNLVNDNNSHLLQMIYLEKNSDISFLFTNIENVQSVFEEYARIAEEYNLAEDLAFSRDNDSLVLAYRDNMVQCINFCRNGEYAAARIFHEVHLSPFVGRILKFTEDMIYRKNLEINATYKEVGEIQTGIIVAVISALGLIVLLNTIVGLYIKVQVTRPILEINQIIENISSGEGDLSRTISIRARDEIGDLAGNFNKFILSLDNMVVHLKTISAGTKKAGTVLADITAETTANTEEISSTMQSMSALVGEFNNETQGAVTEVKQISGAMNHISDLIENQADAVSQSSASMEEISSSITNIKYIAESKKKLSDELRLTALDGQAQMKTSVTSVKKVAESTRGIMAMIEVINDIAASTELLSLNASVEAAHAGSAGNGFKVVATEIRKLSEVASTNAKNINDTLRTVITDIEEANRLNLNAGQTFTNLIEGIRIVAEGMDETLAAILELSAGNKNIVESLSELMRITDEIKEETREINSGADAINRKMTMLSDVSTETLQSIAEITGGVTEISREVIHLSDVGRETEGHILSLDNEINKFKTSRDHVEDSGADN